MFFVQSNTFYQAVSVSCRAIDRLLIDKVAFCSCLRIRDDFLPHSTSILIYSKIIALRSCNSFAVLTYINTFTCKQLSIGEGSEDDTNTHPYPRLIACTARAYVPGSAFLTTSRSSFLTNTHKQLSTAEWSEDYTHIHTLAHTDA